MTLGGIEPATFRFVAHHLNPCVYIYRKRERETERERETTFLNTFDNKHGLFQLEPNVFCVIRKTLRKQDLCQSSSINAATWF